MVDVPQIRHYYEIMDDRARTLAELKVILTAVGSDHALVGGLAAGHHGRERATIDVDLLVPGKRLAPLAQALESRGFVVRSFLPDMIRVYLPESDPDRDEAVADLVSKDTNPVLEAAFDAVEPAVVLGHAVMLVKRGAFVALKFHAAVSPTRRIEDRYQDIVDIGRVVARRFEPGDRELARSVASHMYPGAADELDQMIDDLRHGRSVKI
jgi:hypothetical protein